MIKYLHQIVKQSKNFSALLSESNQKHILYEYSMTYSCLSSTIAFKNMNLKYIEIIKKTKVHLSKSLIIVPEL